MFTTFLILVRELLDVGIIDLDLEQLCGSGEPGATPRITLLRTSWMWQNWNGQKLDEKKKKNITL